jgi:hypothetical protein
MTYSDLITRNFTKILWYFQCPPYIDYATVIVIFLALIIPMLLSKEILQNVLSLKCWMVSDLLKQTHRVQWKFLCFWSSFSRNATSRTHNTELCLSIRQGLYNTSQITACKTDSWQYHTVRLFSESRWTLGVSYQETLRILSPSGMWNRIVW